MLLSPAVRFEVLTALERARENVARGAPTFEAARHYLRLTPKAWAELDKAVDAVLFELQGPPDTTPAPFQRGESAEAGQLRAALQAAHSNFWIPWEPYQGLSRAQLVVVLTRARELVARSPVGKQGQLFTQPQYLRRGT